MWSVCLHFWRYHCGRKRKTERTSEACITAEPCMSYSTGSSTVSTKLHRKPVSRSSDEPSRVKDRGCVRIRTACLPKEATMADGTAHEGSAGRVLTRSLLVRGGWEGKGGLVLTCAPAVSSSSPPAPPSPPPAVSSPPVPPAPSAPPAF